MTTSRNIPVGWAFIALGDIGEWNGGGTPSKSDPSFWSGGSIPWVSPKDMKVSVISDSIDHITEAAVEESAAKLIAPGSILFVTRSGILAHTFPVARTSVAVTVNQDVKALTPAPAFDPDYIAWAARAYGSTILGQCSKDGTTVASVDTALLRSFRLPIAPKEEQHRVVEAIESYLTRIDDAVATLERVQRNLERYRASVLKAAIEGRLVPTEAELARAEGRDYEPASVLLERILAERRRRWEEAELEKMKAKGKLPKGDKWKARYEEPVASDACSPRVLPDGWCWATWAQIGFSQNGRAFPSREYSDGGIRLLRPGNLHVSGRVEWNSKNTRFMPKQWEADCHDLIVGPNEVVMNLTAQSLRDQFLGRVCTTGTTDRCLLNQRLARLTPVLVQPEFILWWFKSPLFRAFVDRLNTGSLIQHMFTSQLAKFTMPLPPLAEQRRIVAELERQLGICDALEEDIQRNKMRMLSLRQSILKWAFEGRLVDQDPADEPASVLLERIKAEREAKPARSSRSQRLPSRTSRVRK